MTDTGPNRSPIPVEIAHPPSDLSGPERPAASETFLLLQEGQRKRTGDHPWGKSPCRQSVGAAAEDRHSQGHPNTERGPDHAQDPQGKRRRRRDQPQPRVKRRLPDPIRQSRRAHQRRRRRAQNAGAGACVATSGPKSPRSHRRRVPTRDPAAHLLRFKRSFRAGDMASPCGPHTGLARSTSGSPLDPAPFRQDEPGAPQRHPRARRPLCSAARALTPTEPGGETRVEATCVNARPKVGTDPGSIPGASKFPNHLVCNSLRSFGNVEPTSDTRPASLRHLQGALEKK